MPNIPRARDSDPGEQAPRKRVPLWIDNPTYTVTGSTMSISGMMRTGVSGMLAQSNKLSTVSDNIANVNTAGYKRGYTEFSSMILGESSGAYNSGNVRTTVRYSIADNGPLQFTTSPHDLAIEGNGFFPVSNGAGQLSLTRAGSFVPEVLNGQTVLVNAAGYRLQGVPLLEAGAEGPMGDIIIDSKTKSAQASRDGVFSANLPAHLAGSDTAQSSLTLYDEVGNPIMLTMNFTRKPGIPSGNEWTVSFSCGNASGSDPTPSTVDLTFDPVTGKYVSGGMVDLAIPHGTEAGATFPFTLDMTGMTQLASEFTPYTVSADGTPAVSQDRVEIAGDGTVYSVLTDGSRIPTYRIPLATVNSPENLRPESGSVFSTTLESGTIMWGRADSSGIGRIQSGALEGSNVDLGNELSAMIEAQSSYTANSKVIQTGSELLDVLLSLKR